MHWTCFSYNQTKLGLLFAVPGRVSHQIIYHCTRINLIKPNLLFSFLWRFPCWIPKITCFTEHLIAWLNIDNWTDAQHFLQDYMFAQRRLWSTQADQTLRCPPEDTLDLQLPTDCPSKTRIRLCGCCTPAHFISVRDVIWRRFIVRMDRSVGYRYNAVVGRKCVQYHMLF